MIVHPERPVALAAEPNIPNHFRGFLLQNRLLHRWVNKSLCSRYGNLVRGKPGKHLGAQGVQHGDG